jgi:FtsZ-binding cell division protein ZapB
LYRIQALRVFHKIIIQWTYPEKEFSIAAMRTKIELVAMTPDALIQVIEQLWQEIDTLRHEINILKAENSKLKAENQELRLENQKLKIENQELKIQNQELKDALAQAKKFRPSQK